jgi:hypothetical protein
MSNTLHTIGTKPHEGSEDIIIQLPEEFDMEANIAYLQRNKNECMFEIENNTITRVIAIGEVQTLVQLKVMEVGTFKDVEKSLIKIRGIVPWTANYVLMRCFRFDRFSY